MKRSSSIPRLSGTLFHVVAVSARFRLFSLVYRGYEHRQSCGCHVESAKCACSLTNLSLPWNKIALPRTNQARVKRYMCKQSLPYQNVSYPCRFSSLSSWVFLYCKWDLNDCNLNRYKPYLTVIFNVTCRATIFLRAM